MKISKDLHDALIAAGKLPKSTKTNKPRVAVPAMPSIRYPVDPTRPFVEFRVNGRAAAWASFTAGARRESRARMNAWKREVQIAFRIAYPGFTPHAGPVKIWLDAYFKPGQVPDIDNVGKATRDALQGFAIVNDREACEVHETRLENAADERDREEVFIYVFSIDRAVPYRPRVPRSQLI